MSAPSSEADVPAPAQTNWFIRSDAATVRILAADRDLDLVQPAELIDAPFVSAAPSLIAEGEEGEEGAAAPEAAGEPDVDLVIMMPELAAQEAPVEAAAAASPCHVMWPAAAAVSPSPTATGTKHKKLPFLPPVTTCSSRRTRFPMRVLLYTRCPALTAPHTRLAHSLWR